MQPGRCCTPASRSSTRRSTTWWTGEWRGGEVYRDVDTNREYTSNLEKRHFENRVLDDIRFSNEVLAQVGIRPVPGTPLVTYQVADAKFDKGGFAVGSGVFGAWRLIPCGGFVFPAGAYPGLTNKQFNHGLVLSDMDPLWGLAHEVDHVIAQAPGHDTTSRNLMKGSPQQIPVLDKDQKITDSRRLTAAQGLAVKEVYLTRPKR